MPGKLSVEKKIRFLIAAVVILAVLYGITLFFDPERVNVRNASFSWAPSSVRDEADGMDITRPGFAPLNLVRKNDRWFARLGEGANQLEAPVKQGRIDDLFRLLTDRGAFSRRGSSAASHADLGLTAETGTRLVIRGGIGVPLLDLFIGHDDTSGKEVFLRKNGENEFRSGARLIATYANGDVVSWYDLRLFQDNPAGLVQRIRITPPDPADPPFAVVKSGSLWAFEPPGGEPDPQKVETYIRSIFEAQGDDFLPPGLESRNFTAGKITVELGDGTARTIQAGEAADTGPGQGRRPAIVSGSPYIYALSQWTAGRLFRTRESLR